jgi:LemA protein
MGKGALIMIFVIWGIVFVAGIWIISTYNTLTALRLRVQNGWHQINVQLKRRYDLIPNLVETVKGYMQFEQDTLQKVIDARSKAMVSTGVKQTAEAESALNASLGKVFALMENYPDLKSNKNVLDLQEELATTENQIAFARQYYNDLVTQYNTKRQVFPGNLIANFFKFQPSEFFLVPGAETALPNVNLSLPR